MGQKFKIDKSTKFVHRNGAISYESPETKLAKVSNCPLQGSGIMEPIRLTCYATGAPTALQGVPACTRYKGQHIGGTLVCTDWGVSFLVAVTFNSKMKALHAQGI